MNYPNIARNESEPTAVIVAGHVPGEALTRLNDLELRVIEIGFSAGEPPFVLKDRPARPLQWFCKLVFGFRPKSALADGRLEALRAMAAAIRDVPVDPDASTAAAFLEAGWTRDDMRQIQEIAALRRPALTAAGQSRTLWHPFRASSTHPRECVRIASVQIARINSYVESMRFFVLAVRSLFAGSSRRTELSRAA